MSGITIFVIVHGQINQIALEYGGSGCRAIGLTVNDRKRIYRKDRA